MKKNKDLFGDADIKKSATYITSHRPLGLYFFNRSPTTFSKKSQPKNFRRSYHLLTRFSGHRFAPPDQNHVAFDQGGQNGVRNFITNLARKFRNNALHKLAKKCTPYYINMIPRNGMQASSVA